MTKSKPYSANALKGTGLRGVSPAPMPLGGMGAGNVCLNGYGGLQDFSIRNKPETSAVPDGHGSRDAAFAILHIKGSRKVPKLLEGPMPPEKVYNLGTKGQGHRGGGHEEIPRFKNCRFKGEFPFGSVGLSDPHVPLKVDILGFKTFFSAATGFGTITLRKKSLAFDLIEGDLIIERLYLHGKKVKLNGSVHTRAEKRASIRLNT